MLQYSVVPATMNLGFTGAMPVGSLPQLAQLAPDKYRQPELVVVSSAPPGHLALAGIAPMCTVNTGMKYQAISASSTMALNNIAYGGQTYVQAADQHQLKVEQRMMDKREYREEVHHDIMATMMQQQGDEDHLSALLAPAGTMQSGQQLVVVLHEPKEAAAIARAIKQENRPDRIINNVPTEFISIGEVGEGGTWQSIGGGVADYLSALPLPLHHLLKYSTPGPMPVAMETKRDEPHTIVTVTQNTLPPISTVNPQMQSHNPVGGVLVQTSSVMNQGVNTIHSIPPPKKKKKKKTQKEKKPRPKPGEIRLTTALDGSTLYCCPECHMAYPERGLLEQHLLGHTLERKFICDICNAALKRKDHLTRHKQSHNPERPHVCNVCMKAFKRKEQLTLHFVIHSGEKRHVCNECGKGFYRKDHLRKHTRSHIARRVKAEMSLQTESSESTQA